MIFHFVATHGMMIAMIAIATLNIIALIAIWFARRASDRAFDAIELASSEIAKALREIDNVSVSRASRSVASSAASQFEAKI